MDCGWAFVNVLCKLVKVMKIFCQTWPGGKHGVVGDVGDVGDVGENLGDVGDVGENVGDVGENLGLKLE